MKTKSLLYGLMILSAATLPAFADPAFSDSFEGSSLDPFWTAGQGNGTVLVSGSMAHSGQQSLQMTRTAYWPQLNLTLTHVFSGPQYGTVSVWFYDVGKAYYSSLTLGNSALGISSGWGVQDWDAGNYYYNPFNLTGGAVPSRSVGWHLFSVNITPTSQTLSLDGQQIFSGSNSAGFDSVTLTTSGPYGFGSYYYDDFSFTPLSSPSPSPIQITSLSGNGSLSWTNLPELSNGLFSIEWAPNLTSGWHKSWGQLGGMLTTGLTSSVEVPMFFRVKAYPNPLLPFPVDQQMTYLVSNAVGNVFTQQIAVLNYVHPLASTNEFAVLEQDNFRSGVFLLRSTDTAAYSYSSSLGEVLEFQLGPVGTTWTNFNYQGSSGDLKVTLAAIENVTVPAGTFLCYKFHKEILGGSDSGRDEWLCPQVGFIKWVDYEADYTQNAPITYQFQSMGPRSH